MFNIRDPRRRGRKTQVYDEKLATETIRKKTASFFRLPVLQRQAGAGFLAQTSLTVTKNTLKEGCGLKRMFSNAAIFRPGRVKKRTFAALRTSTSPSSAEVGRLGGAEESRLQM